MKLEVDLKIDNIVREIKFTQGNSRGNTKEYIIKC